MMDNTTVERRVAWLNETKQSRRADNGRKTDARQRHETSFEKSSDRRSKPHADCQRDPVSLTLAGELGLHFSFDHVGERSSPKLSAFEARQVGCCSTEMVLIGLIVA
jgi:hypothetical protein